MNRHEKNNKTIQILFFYLSGLLHSNCIIYLWLFLQIRIFQSDEEDIVKEKQVKLNVEVIG